MDSKSTKKLIQLSEVRARIAPSPTGPLHLGTARTALFNYLFAKKEQGSFILRIEDTDIERSDPRWEKNILDSLKWLGLEWDEGPTAISQREIAEIPNPKSQIPKEKKSYIGDYGPYRQSERKESYAKYIEKFLTEGKAYYCFCSEEELEAKRQYQISIGKPPIYDGKCRELSSETVQRYLAEGKHSIIRFKIPQKRIVFQDLIRGEIDFNSALIGDFSIAKDLVTPLYNFAVVIDDFEMEISHVIRGEDHISNTPKQILLQEALDFPRPKYAHLPLILGPDRQKLSKRHGAVSVSDYRKQGYLPEALINFLAFLGWNPDTEREIYSMPSLIKEFSLEKVQKAGAVFNIQKLDFLNGFYIRQRSVEKLTELCLSYFIEAGFLEKEKREKELEVFEPESAKFKIKETGEEIDFKTLEKIVLIYQERLKKLSEITKLTDFFFKEKLDYQKDLLRWKGVGLPADLSAEDLSKEEALAKAGGRELKEALLKLENILSEIKSEDFTKENLEKILLPEAEKFRIKGERDRGYLLWPLRVALTGKEASAGPFEIAEILGKEKVLKRVKEATEMF